MSCRVNEEEAAVHSCIGDMSVPLCGKLFSQVARVLVFNLKQTEKHQLLSQEGGKEMSIFEATYVSRDGLPASVIVDLITVSRRIDDVQLEPDSILDNG